MQYVLSNYPLSKPFRERLESLLSVVPRYLTVSELRQGSVLAMIRSLGRVRGERLTIAIEDDSTAALLPILSLMASLTSANRLEVVDPQMDPRSLSRWQSGLTGLRLARESLAAGTVFLRARSRLRRLLKLPRIEPGQKATGRVAYLNCNLWFGVKAGGSVGHISGVANALMDHGHDVDFYSAGGRLLVDDRARHVPLAAPRMLAMPFETTYYRFSDSCLDQVDREMRSRPVDMLYQRMSLGNHTGVALSRRHRIPLVLEYNGSEAWIARHWGRPLKFHDSAVMAEDVCLKHAHVVVTISEVLGAELADRGVERDRIVVYPNCIDPSFFDPGLYPAEESGRRRAELGFSPTDVVCTFVGTFGQWHGSDVLALAIKRIAETRPQLLEMAGLRFLMVGDGLKMPLVREILSGAGLEKYVRLIGLVPQREAPKYLALSDVLLSPHVANADGSAFFGSPTKLFEYMAMERAIFASDLNQIGEVLRPALRVGHLPTHGPGDADHVAVLGQPGSVEDLICGLEFLAGNPEWRSRLAANARALALDRYTWKHHVSAILDRLDAVQKNRRSG